VVIYSPGPLTETRRDVQILAEPLMIGHVVEVEPVESQVEKYRQQGLWCRRE